MSGNVWTVPAVVVRVVDGDTLVLRLDLGWNITLQERCRLVGVNAPELSTDAGQEARKFLIGLLGHAGGALDGTGALLTFISHQIDKYGRPLGQALASTPQGQTLDLGYQMVSAGHAVPM